MGFALYCRLCAFFPRKKCSLLALFPWKKCKQAICSCFRNFVFAKHSLFAHYRLVILRFIHSTIQESCLDQIFDEIHPRRRPLYQHRLWQHHEHRPQRPNFYRYPRRCRLARPKSRNRQRLRDGGFVGECHYREFATR